MARFIILLSLLAFGSNCFGQIEADTSYRSLSLRLHTNDGYRVLTFRKGHDTEKYALLHYYASSNQPDSVMLSSEAGKIEMLWDSAAQVIDIELTSANIGYPLEYRDVLRNQVLAFRNSSEWQAHVQNNGRDLNYPLMRRVMLDNHVYVALEAVLKKYGYKLTGLSTEKHGFVTREKLAEIGEDPDAVVPMPFMVYLQVERM